MDPKLRAYLDAMRREIKDGQERVLNRIAALEQAFGGLLAGKYRHAAGWPWRPA